MSSQDKTDYQRWWHAELDGVDCEGLSAGEVSRVATDQGVTLPDAYSGFLNVAGRRCGDLWVFPGRSLTRLSTATPKVKANPRSCSSDSPVSFSLPS